MRQEQRGSDAPGPTAGAVQEYAHSDAPRARSVRPWGLASWWWVRVMRVHTPPTHGLGSLRGDALKPCGSVSVGVGTVPYRGHMFGCAAWAQRAFLEAGILVVGPRAAGVHATSMWVRPAAGCCSGMVPPGVRPAFTGMERWCACDHGGGRVLFFAQAGPVGTSWEPEYDRRAPRRSGGILPYAVSRDPEERPAVLTPDSESPGALPLRNRCMSTVCGV